jgi:LEA14-like dessication related protein
MRPSPVVRRVRPQPQHLALLLLPLFSVPACAPKVKKVRPRVTGIGWSGVDMEFDVQVHNPNFVPLRTPRFRAALDIEGSELVRTEVPVAYSLGARRSSTVTIPTRISYRRVWDTYETIRDAGEASYRLRGALLFALLWRDLAVPVSHEGKFPILRLPRFEAVSIDFSRPTPTRMLLAVNVEVTNRNVFEVDIRDLGYAVELGAVPIAGLTVSTRESAIGAGETGTVVLAGELSGLSAMRALVNVGAIKKARLVPTGYLKTPYGKVKLDKRAKR